MGGGETAHLLREIRPDLPILFMSGHGADEVARRLGELHGGPHIAKPFRAADLGLAMKRLLEG